MNKLEATLLEDFGAVDRGLVRRGLLAERGITGVLEGPGEHALTIEYDAEKVPPATLFGILHRHGLFCGVVPEPAELEGRERWHETLRDGRRVLIRPIRPDDVERNAQFLDKLSPPSKHFLFLGGVGRLGDSTLRRLCEPDHARDMAFVALALDPVTSQPAEQIGLCRYAGADPINGAEISVAVADAWQHQGLGRIMLRHLIDYATAHGVRRLYSMDAVGNSRMRKLARELGFAEGQDPHDVHQVIYSLGLRTSASLRP